MKLRPKIRTAVALSTVTPAPAPVRAETYIEARAAICAVLCLNVGEDEARRLMILADMDPAAAVAPMLANALQAAEATLARVFPGGVA